MGISELIVELLTITVKHGMIQHSAADVYVYTGALPTAMLQTARIGGIWSLHYSVVYNDAKSINVARLLE